jgi:hypothetical protein
VVFAEGIQLHQARSVHYFFIATLFWGSAAVSYAADSTGVSSTSVVRSQLQSIADVVVDSAKLDSKSKVGVLVEGDCALSLAENAFVEALQKRNYTSVLSPDKTLEQTLHIMILGVDIKVRKLEANLSERNISTSLEARTMKGAEREVRLLGTFYRESKDTAETFPSVQFPLVQKNDETGVMQRLLTPIIVLGGAILVVYLLFTVRS